MALYRIYLERDAALLEVNPLIVTKKGDLVALDAKINIDANAMFRQKALAGVARSVAGRPDRARGQRTRPQLRLARRRYRLHGERRRPGHGHHGPDQAARRQARQLPRRGRRRHGRARHRGLQADPVQQEGARDPGQHLWRHRALRPDRRGRDDRGQAGGCGRARGGAAGGNERGCGARNARAQRTRHHPRHRSHRRGPQGRRAGRRQEENEHSRQQEHPRDLPGLHRPAGHVPFRAEHQVRHEDGRRRHARPWRRKAPRPAGVRHRGRCRQNRPAPPPA